jgi:dimethylargininase
MRIALTRSVPPSIVNCELTHLNREPINFARAAEQHGLYERALVALGCTIQRLPSLSDLPDSVFVEDTALVLPEIAIIARPGAAPRRPEVTIYVGESTRTNTEGIRQLADFVSAYGYAMRPVKVSACLHLKSAVTRVAEDVILLNSAWVDSSSFKGMRQIEIHPGEPFAANALWIGEHVIYSGTYDETRRRLEENNINVLLVETDELQKAEGGVTCCSILISAHLGSGGGAKPTS